MCIFSDVGSKNGCAARATRLEAAISCWGGGNLLNQTSLVDLLHYQSPCQYHDDKKEDRNKQFNNRKPRMN